MYGILRDHVSFGEYVQPNALSKNNINVHRKIFICGAAELAAGGSQLLVWEEVEN